jgi:UDP-GlcNAc:undecaprenyl-phosphate GlcNAc-1-phosphate transferase
MNSYLSARSQNLVSVSQAKDPFQMTPSLLLGLAGGLLIGFLMTFFLTRFVRGGAHRFDLLDRPTQGRSVHLNAMPTGGGLAVAGGVVAAVGVLYGFLGQLPGPMQTLPFWIGALLMLGTGLWDDKHSLDPKTKFLLQLAAAYLLLHAGVYLQVAELSFVGGGGFEWALYSVPLSMIWVVGVINAVNLIDGLDGLATGVTGIAFLACAALFGVKGELGLMAVGLVMTAAIVGFLPYNFKPASIFMGDSGSLFLGYLLAAYTLQGSLHPEPLMALLILPVLLGVPVLDTVGAIVRRLASDRTVFAPDRSHIHHRLVEQGSERRAVLTLYSVAAWFGSAAFLMGILPAVWGYALAGGTVAIALVWAWRLGCLAPLPSEELPAEAPPSTADEGQPSGEMPDEEVLEVLPGVGGDGSHEGSVQAAARGE